MVQNLTQCPICEGKEQTLFLSCKDHSISKENFTIVQCKQCTFKFTNPRPSEDSIGKYYQSENYISHTDTKDGIINKAYHLVRKITLRKKCNLINALTKKGKILDVGCGTGYFLKMCKENGWQIDGTEPDENARNLAEQNTGKEIEKSIFSVEKTSAYNIVSLWHVLEHIHKLNETLIKINLLLKEDGRLIIAVPNSDSKDAMIYQDAWAAYDVPRHLYHFNQKSMEALLAKHGFIIEKTLPMKFDSFYVSMMSEGYLSENQANKYIKTILNGCISNIYGFFNNNNYSSIIYVAKKNIND